MIEPQKENESFWQYVDRHNHEVDYIEKYGEYQAPSKQEKYWYKNEKLLNKLKGALSNFIDCYLKNYPMGSLTNNEIQGLLNHLYKLEQKIDKAR